MKRIALTLISIIAAAMLGGCDDGTSDELSNGRRGGTRDPSSTQGGEDSTYNHENNGPSSGSEPPAGSVKVVGSPEVTARLHACGKMSVQSLRQLLDSRGLGGRGGGRPDGSPSGMQLFTANGAAATLGAANYDGRVGEAAFASTSAMSKMFDIFSMASYDAVAANYEAPACPGVKIVGGDGKFTKDGISCLIGKPATPEHVAIANDAIDKNPTDGAKLAIAALLSAAHTCQ